MTKNSEIIAKTDSRITTKIIRQCLTVFIIFPVWTKNKRKNKNKNKIKTIKKQEKNKKQKNNKIKNKNKNNLLVFGIIILRQLFYFSLFRNAFYSLIVKQQMPT